MARTAKTAKKRTSAVPVRPARPANALINPAPLTEDEADYLHYLKHKHEKRHSLDEVMRDAGLNVEC